MKQVFIQKGKALLGKVPEPAINDNEILVQVHYSCISAGTESYKIKASGRSLIRKVLDRPQDIKKVVERIKTGGIRDAAKRVKGKIEGKNPIGYSASGVVIAVGKNIRNIKPGHKAAVAGDGIANHAEFVAVPENLAVKIPDRVSLKDASTVALGSIAMQGVRRCRPEVGEFVVVLGLGNIGQITYQILNVAGCRVIGIDIEASRINKAMAIGIEHGINAQKQDSIEEILNITGGKGADSVLITASSSNDSVINDAMRMCRKKGKIVIVGNVNLNIDREEFYKKELDVMISTSYGPGRYDLDYEEKASDYPYPYVRWTENRNMMEYLRLISEGKISLSPIIEKTYRLEDAEKAFKSISSGGRSPLIVLLEYEKEPAREKSVINDKHKPKKKKISLGIIGAGGFVNDVHLSNLVKLERLFDITAICSKRGSNAASIAEQYNAGYATTDYKKILSDGNIDAVLIATRHDLHAVIAGEAATAGKAVFVEKPMALEEKELRGLVKILNTKNTCYMIGFNRRFSPFSVKAKEMIDQRIGPVIINYRVNAGFIPPESWVHSSEGGGRNIGEACHFYDLFDYFTGCKAIDIQAMGADHRSDLFRANENFAVLIKFEDGSVCNLVYTAMGNEGVPKEQIDIYFDRKIIQINDFKELRFHGIKEKDIISGNQEKGHFEEIKSFGNCLKNNQDPIPLWQLVQATEISFEVETQLSER